MLTLRATPANKSACARVFARSSGKFDFVAMELETEHLLTVCSPMDACIISAVGLYGTEPVVVTADGDMQLSLHRPFCETREVR